ncbi:thermonuclease family protein [Virgibacillus flavescens]|uniref:thermonuclease family protein n=1 Tax=Virgibacillus flavescens TaxID=1611422 RepID=UPI003D327964
MSPELGAILIVWIGIILFILFNRKSRSVRFSSFFLLLILLSACGSEIRPTDESGNQVEEKNSAVEKQPEKAKDKTEDQTEQNAAEEAVKTTAANATVTRVIDGDTIEISMNGTNEDVRLLLIDTPETVHPSKPVEAYGPEASQFVKEKLTGEEVRVEVGKEERDKYGRLLAYVFIDGETIQEKLLRNGLARTAYLYNDLTMLEEFHKVQETAISKEIGVWSIPGYSHVDHNHGYHYQEDSGEEPTEKEQGDQKELQYDPFGADRDCGDFSTHEQAQNFYVAAGGPENDPHRLDRDGEGSACDSLP